MKPKNILALGVIIWIIGTSCKKEVSPNAIQGNLSSSVNKVPASEGSPDFIVKNGASIQATIDAATPGSLIYIEPGIYNEAITVDKPGIKLLGLNDGHSQGVIIQNPGDKENGITARDAGDGFLLKNVTVKNFEENGVLLIRVDGFVLSHVEAIDNGEYGLFPVRSSDGLIEHCTAMGHTDAGIYVGLSSDVIVENNKAFENVTGFEIRNSSNLIVRKNHSYDNVAGIIVMVLPGLPVKTSSNIIVVANHVTNNNHINFAEPGGFNFFIPTGSGILLVGTDNTLVEDNKVKDNNSVGIATVSSLLLGALAGLPPEAFADIEPNPDGVKVIDNNLSNNGNAPPPGIGLPGADLFWDGSGTNNCWSNNKFASSFPTVLPSCN